MKNIRLSLAALLLPVGLIGLWYPDAARAGLSLDPAFGTNGVAVVDISTGSDKMRALAVQADGALVLSGWSVQTVGNQTAVYVAVTRQNGTTGALDPGFGTGGIVTFLPGLAAANNGGGDGRALAIQPLDQKIIVAGRWDANEGAGGELFVARLDTTGALDPTFGTAGVVLFTPPDVTQPQANGVALRSDGGIIVVGTAAAAGASVGFVVGLTSTGAIDPGYASAVVPNPLATGTNFRFNDVAILPGDVVLAAGGGGDLVLAKFTSAGALDPAFDGDGIASFNYRATEAASGTVESFDMATAVSVGADSNILVGGLSADNASSASIRRVLARVTATGALDTSYGSGGFAPLGLSTTSPPLFRLNTFQESNRGLGIRPSGDSVLAGADFDPTQVSPAGISLASVVGVPALITDLAVLDDGNGSVVVAGESDLSDTNKAFVTARLIATDLADGPDTVPDPISFTTQRNLELEATATSNAVTISGINAPAAISVSAGSSYAIGCTSAFVSAPGVISNGQTVCVRTAVGSVDKTAKNVVLTVGGVVGVFTAVTGDSTPDQFTLTDQTGVLASTVVVAAPITLTGLNIPAAVVVTGGEYSVGCTGTFSAAAGSAEPGEQICVRHTSSEYPGAVTTTTLRVGAGTGTSDAFTSTTAGTLDTSPDAFSFDDQTGVEPSTVINSAAETITGISNPTTVTVIGGSYSIGCTATFISAPSTILDGQTVCVRHTSAAVGLTAVNTTLVVGDKQDIFTSTTREADTTPAAFTVVDQVDVDPSIDITSAPVTISGIDALTPISTTNGSYSIGCTAAYTGSAGTISNGQTVCVRHTSAATGSTVVTTTLTVGGVSDDFRSTTRVLDSTPDQFRFVPQTGVPLATVITSAVVQLSGYDVNVSASITGGTYSVGCTSNFTAANSNNVAPGARVCVRHTSGSLGGVVTETVLTVGGVSDTFSSTTLTGDASPTQFSFIDRTGVDLSEPVTSAPVTIQGTTIASPVTITGGEYSIGCTSTFTEAAGSIAPGRTVCVRHQSSFDSSTDTNTTLTIGDVSDVFTSTTKVGDQTPDDFSFDTQTGVALSTIIVSSPITISGVDSPVKLFVSGPSGDVGFARNCTTPYASPNREGEVFENGDTLCILLFSPDADLTSAVATATIGGGTPESQKSATFTLTTGETVPAAFTFTDQVGVLLNATVYALPITITGITAPSSVKVRNGQWQLNCTGSFTSVDGVVSDGETICVRHIAAGSLSTLTSTLLVVGGETETDPVSGQPVIDPDTGRPGIIGGIRDTFTSTTVADKPLPGGSALDPLSLLLLAPLLGYRRRRGTLAANR